MLYLETDSSRDEISSSRTGHSLLEWSGPFWGVETITAYLEIIKCSLLLSFALVYIKNLNYVYVILHIFE